MKLNLTTSTIKALVFFLFANMFVFQSAFAGWDEGVAAIKAKNYTKAVTEFEEVVDKNPKVWRGHYMLGLSYHYMGQAYASNKSFQKAYDLNPNDLSIKQGLKRFLGTKGKKQQAAIHYMYGTTALKLGMKTEGKQAKLKALKLDPGFILYQK